ncbi:MAG: Replicative DNA helicase (DnaB), partial [uncultured Blastococcus sp.]
VRAGRRAPVPGESWLGAGVRAHPAAGHPRGAVGARRHAAVQGRHRRRRRGGAGDRLLQAGPPDDLRRRRRPLRQGRAGRPDHRVGGADPPRRDRPRRRRPLPAHPAVERPHGGQRRLLRPDRRRAGGPAPPRRGRHAHRPARLRRLGCRWRGRHGRPRAAGHLRRHRAALVRGLHAARAAHAADDGRARGHRQPRRLDVRRPHRLRRPRRVDQRPAPRPAHRHRRPSGARQEHAGSRHRPCSFCEDRAAERDLLARDEQDRDHHAPAVRRGARPAAPHAVRHHDRRRLEPPRAAHGRGRRGTALHRRLAQPHDDGDPGQGPAAAPAQRPAPHRHRLPAAHERQQEGREPSAGGLRAVQVAQAPRQGARDPGDRHEPAQPRCRAAHRQEAADLRPPRVGQHRAGRRHGHPAAPRGRVREGEPACGRGRLHRGQAPQRADRDDHGGVPGSLQSVRRHEPGV